MPLSIPWSVRIHEWIDVWWYACNVPGNDVSWKIGIQLKMKFRKLLALLASCCFSLLADTIAANSCHKQPATAVKSAGLSKFDHESNIISISRFCDKWPTTFPERLATTTIMAVNQFGMPTKPNWHFYFATKMLLAHWTTRKQASLMGCYTSPWLLDDAFVTIPPLL